MRVLQVTYNLHILNQVIDLQVHKIIFSFLHTDFTRDDIHSRLRKEFNNQQQFIHMNYVM